MFDTDSNKQVPEWAKNLIEGLVAANDRFVGVVKNLQERQDMLEARLDEKPPEKEKAAPKEPTPEEVAQVVEKLFI